MTLYDKVTWPWAWPFLILVLVTLERWSFFCFAGFWGRGFRININPHCNYQAWPCMTRSRVPERDLPNSGSSNARAMILFFCFAGFWGRWFQMIINPHCNYQAWPCMTRSRDPERDLLNSGSSDARAMIFLFRRFLGSQMSNKYESTL